MKYYYLLLFFITFFILSCNDNTQNEKKPNILFIMSDDHAYQAISAYDDRLIQTPNIDRIAEEGMLFANASVTNSICEPSRAVILTGKHSHINGKIDNIAKFDDSQMTFPQLFKENGYQTAMFGKLHFGNNPKGIDDFLILPGQGDYINPRFLGKDKDTIITGYVTDIITDLTLDWFRNKRDKNKPFLTFYLHKAPHRAWWPSPEKFAEFYDKKFPEPDKALFNKDAELEIDWLKEFEEINIEIQGHTDDIGPDKANLALSLDRAFSVMEYLLNKGIDKKRLKFTGFGESKPKVSNKSSMSRSINRRTDFLIF